MAMMMLLAALMLFYCSRSITLIAKFPLGPEIPQTLEKVYLTLTLCIFNFSWVYESLQLVHKHGNDKIIC